VSEGTEGSAELQRPKLPLEVEFYFEQLSHCMTAQDVTTSTKLTKKHVCEHFLLTSPPTIWLQSCEKAMQTMGTFTFSNAKA